MKRLAPLFVSGMISVILFTLNYVGISKLCGGAGYSQCTEVLYAGMMTLLPTIPFFLFSFIVFWMRKDIYDSWFRFARVWVPLSMFLIFIAPVYGSDWMYPIEKATVLLITNILFVLISLIIIARAWWQGRAV